MVSNTEAEHAKLDQWMRGFRLLDGLRLPVCEDL
jgi:hypothetical protein